MHNEWPRGLPPCAWAQCLNLRSNTILRASLCGDVMMNSASSLREKGCLYHRAVVNIRTTGCSIQLFSVPRFSQLANKWHVPVCLGNGDCDSLLVGKIGVHCFRNWVLLDPGVRRSESKSYARKSHYSTKIISCVLVQWNSLEILPFPCDKVSFFPIFLNLCNTGISA